MPITNYFKSLDRALSVLGCFSPEKNELSGVEIARSLGIHRTTAYRILSVLENKRMVVRVSQAHKYSIGPALYILGSLYLETTDLLKVTAPVMELLNDLTSEAINLSIIDRKYVTLIMRKEAKYPFRWAARIGTSLPAYSSAQGKILLSELTDNELDSLYPNEILKQLTKKTIATKKELKLELEQIRKNGIAFNSEGAYEGIDGVASAIRNTTGKPIAAIGSAVPIFRMNQAKRERLASVIRMGASLISYQLGYQDMLVPVHNVDEIRSRWEDEADKPTGKEE